MRRSRSGASGAAASSSMSRSACGQHVPAGLLDQRPLDGLVAQRAGQVADRREAQLGGDDEPVQHLRHLGARGALERQAGGEPPVEHRGHRRHLPGRALLGEEDAVHRLLQLRPGLEVGHPVVPQHPRQPHPEAVGQRLALEVQRVQVRVEVLARAVHRLELGLLGRRRPVARQLAQVGEGGEHLELGVQQLLVVVGQLAAHPAVLVDQPAAVLGVHVVAGDQGAERLQQRPRGGPRVGRRLVGGGREGHPGALGDRVRLAETVQPHQRRARVDLGVHPDEDLPQAAGERRPHGGLHLHALEDDDRLPGLDLVAHARPRPRPPRPGPAPAARRRRPG